MRVIVWLTFMVALAPCTALQAQTSTDAAGGGIGQTAIGDSPAAGTADSDRDSRTPSLLQYGLRSALTVSNRAYLDAYGSARPGQSLELSPYVRALGVAPDRSWFLDYRMRNFVRWPGADFDAMRHDLRAATDLPVGGQGLRLSA
jgi:hypothetical protein